MIGKSARESLSSTLRAIGGLSLKVAEPLARYTSIKVGGPADYFLDIQNSASLARVLGTLKGHRVPYHILGRGSNVLVSDRGVRGAVIRLGSGFKEIQWQETEQEARVIIGAAFPVARLVRVAMAKGYTGLEFAEGIPASVGGALVMNAGAYGCEMDRVVERVEGVTSDGQAVAFSRQDLAFSYRSACLPLGTVVTRVKMRLGRGEAQEVSRKISELTKRRKNSQPFGRPNAGSMFRNPSGYIAGRLIEEAGLKGAKVGRVKISERHANFIVNLGGASADEVRRLMELAGVAVKNQCGVQLEPEIQFLGEWGCGLQEVPVESRMG